MDRLLLHASSTKVGGLQFNKILNTRVDNAGVGLSLLVDGAGGYINSNTFEFLRLWACRKFVEFALPLDQYEYTPIWANTFTDLQCECQAPGDSPVQTEVGVDNVCGNHNTFFDVKVWDIQRAVAPAKTAIISNKADQTLIIGGLLAGANLKDNGTATKIVDS